MIAKFNQSRNDMHWSHWDSEDGFIRWTGYDDDFWWQNVAGTDHFRNRVGKKSGRTYRLDPENCEIQVLAEQSVVGRHD